MVDKYQPDLGKINNLDEEASRLGMGGNLSPEVDEKLYKERMQKKKKFKQKELKREI